MDFSKLTNRSRAAIAEAEAVARTYSHQEVDSLHLIKSLLEQEQGLVAPLLERSEFPVAAFRRLLGAAKLAKRAKVEGVDGVCRT